MICLRGVAVGAQIPAGWLSGLVRHHYTAQHLMMNGDADLNDTYAKGSGERKTEKPVIERWIIQSTHF